jgi:hypothetical protein
MRIPVIEEGPHLYVGKPCRYGHAGLRYRVSGNCVECSRKRALAVRRAERKYSMVELDTES